MKKYDELTNLYYAMAWTYNGLNDHNNSCKYFNKALATYAENIRLNPSVRLFSPGLNSFPEEVAYYDRFVPQGDIRSCPYYYAYEEQ